MSNVILTPFSNLDKRESMLEFLAREFHSPNRLTGSRDYDSAPMLQRGEEREIGITLRQPAICSWYNAGTSTFERSYSWVMCAWMAIQDGARTRKQGQLRPYLLYNGDEKIVILTNGRDGDQTEDSISTDENGFSSLYMGKGGRNGNTLSSKGKLLTVREVAHLNVLMKRELERLTEAYQR